MGLLEELNIKPGVIYGDDVLKLFTYAKEKGFAIPACNVVCCCSLPPCSSCSAAAAAVVVGCRRSDRTTRKRGVLTIG